MRNGAELEERGLGAEGTGEAAHTPVWADSSLLTLTLPSRVLRL